MYESSPRNAALIFLNQLLFFSFSIIMQITVFDSFIEQENIFTVDEDNEE